MPDSHAAQPDVKIGKTDDKETAPRPQHVAIIEAGDAVIRLGGERSAGEPVAPAADQMTHGMAAECVTAEHADIQRQDQCSHADAEVAVKPECFPGVMSQED